MACSYFEGFGRENPSKIWRERLEAQQQQESEQSSEEGHKAAKEQRRNKKADTRDKAVKDEARSWFARIGLVG